MSKSDPLRVADYLAHIVQAIDRIHRYVEDIAEFAFLEDEKTQDAVVRNFEILGEAAHNVEQFHPQFAQAHADVPWALMYPCATASRMGTSKWTMNWCGRRFMRICQN